MKIILFHNHNCSKSRACLELLKKKDVEFELRNYIREPFELSEIEEIISNLEDNPEKIIRNNKEFDHGSINSKTKLGKFLYENQKLLQRPILFIKILDMQATRKGIRNIGHRLKWWRE